jgi:hypothetical protein
VNFPVVEDLAGLLWVVNLGCIDLNLWYARCDDVDRPDYLHFALDPTPGATFGLVRKAALLLREELDALKSTFTFRLCADRFKKMCGVSPKRSRLRPRNDISKYSHRNTESQKDRQPSAG